MAAARALALILALVATAPAAGLAEDLVFHAGHGGHRSTEVVGLDAAVAGDQVDPGMACHAHCGCHAAAILGVDGAPLPDRPARAHYGRVAASGPSVSPDRLPRPPRA